MAGFEKFGIKYELCEIILCDVNEKLKGIGFTVMDLEDDRVQPLRDVFITYELLAYLSVRATQIGMKACEVPVTRAFPKQGKTPTKISFFKGNSELMKILIRNARGAYKPEK